MKTKLDDRTKSAINDKLRDWKSPVREAARIAIMNVGHHRNPYKKPDGTKVYPEKLKIFITAIDIIIAYFGQRGRCYYSHVPIDIAGTKAKTFHSNGLSMNRYDHLQEYTPENCVASVQEVFRIKMATDVNDISYDEIIKDMSADCFKYDTRVVDNQYNFELRSFIRFLDDNFKGLTQVDNLITELNSLIIK